MINDSLIKFGSSKRVWWPDEAPMQFAEGLPETANIVVSHEAPLSFDPLLMQADYMRNETFLKIVESRKYLDYVLSHVKPASWFYGHYHCHFEGSYQNTLYRCLDIAEMTQIT